MVIGFALGQGQGQIGCQRLGLEKQAPARSAVSRAAEWQAMQHIARTIGCGQLIQGAADLACVARHLGHAFFMAIEFFQHDHGQINIVFFEAEQAGRIV